MRRASGTDSFGAGLVAPGGDAVAIVYDGDDILKETVTGGSSPGTFRYIHGPGIDEPLAKIQNPGPSEVLTYYHADGLGSIVATTSQAGAIVSTRRYDAWGNLEVGASTPGYAFTGREWDPETGLYYYRARYYDPKVGRFISEDPIGFGGGVNFYSYVKGSPANQIDPMGLAGHHFFPQTVFNNLEGLSEEAWRVFDKATTGWAPGIPRHGWSKAHSLYNDAVKELWQTWTSERGIAGSKMTEAEAKAFLEAIRASNNPAIREFLLDIEKKLASAGVCTKLIRGLGVPFFIVTEIAAGGGALDAADADQIPPGMEPVFK